jgi:hypothetical protein
MTKVMQSFAASAPQAENFAAEFIPLPRINQLLVISHSEAAWSYAKRWLDRIDVVAEGPGRRIFIYPVANGKAEDLAAILTQALGLPSTGGPRPTQPFRACTGRAPVQPHRLEHPNLARAGCLRRPPRLRRRGFHLNRVIGKPCETIGEEICVSGESVFTSWYFYLRA